MTGLEVAEQAAGRCHIVFVTAFDQHAISAFEQGAIDYVMKPVSVQRLATTVTRLKDRISQPPADLSGLLARLQRQVAEGKSYLRWVNASAGKSIKLITVEEVCYFRADTKYTLVVTPASESLIRKSIKDLIDELDPNLFWQIHRSTLVNVSSIAGVTRDMFESQDQCFDLHRQLVGLAKWPATSVGQAFEPQILVALEDLVAHLA